MGRHAGSESGTAVREAPVRVALSGRAGLTDGECPIHGRAEDGSPCARFAHLDPTGRGLRVGFWRRLTVLPRRLMKPVLLFGFVGLVLWAAAHQLPGLFTSLPGVGK